jgi:undecaprenyl diphosphate synthase
MPLRSSGISSRSRVCTAPLSRCGAHGMTGALDPMNADVFPRHVAIIMDGNGRWAAARHRPRQAGHRAGIDAVRRTVRAASDLGLGFLTLFGFSSENWKRPRAEVDYLMDLLRFFIKRETAELHANQVRIRIIGERAGLAGDILTLIAQAEAKTRDNQGLALQIAFNYGGQQEILAAGARLLADSAAGRCDISEATLSARMWFADVPDPDLLIRTGGEKRLSNFLLWQAVNSELVFADRLWPDFGRPDLEAAIAEWRRRAGDEPAG